MYKAIIHVNKLKFSSSFNLFIPTFPQDSIPTLRLALEEEYPWNALEEGRKAHYI